MKKGIIFIMLGSSILFYACSENKTEDIEPNAVQKFNNNEVVSLNKNLRPSAAMPDLQVNPFFQSGAVSITALNYKIPISFKEQNIGTANDLGAYADTLKVYQKIPASLTYTYRFVGNFLRTAHIPVGGTYHLNAVVSFPIKWRPADGKINLVIKADGGNTIAELDETNNLSPTIWNIILP